ncbi:DNA/RNA non-specific endonuclease [Streptococcus didelphis]|uniref:DNA/RNA non-specific endonuclease n=2 Tax=Streptococcus didelphis TaxID=102886 RepID=UPI0003760CCF|nr:DNA/RNA non-specific endonuclease [Streptococcus didelphis]
MPRNFKKFHFSSLLMTLVSLCLGIGSLTTPDIVHAQDPSPVWTIGQYPNYYRVEGSANINPAEFPKIYTTTEKVYNNSGRSTKRVTVSDIQYSVLDGYGRSGQAFGVITKDMIDMAAGYRKKWESNPEPSGWYSYSFKDTGAPAREADYKHSPRKVKRLPNNLTGSIFLSNGRVHNGYLFDRSHLIADSLGGRAFRNNLITGTRTQNVGNNDRRGGMQYLEAKVYDYINRNPSVFVYYRARPVYLGNELLPRYVLVSALSSDGAINETARVFNSANGFNINYQTGGLLNVPGLKANDSVDDSVQYQAVDVELRAAA